MDLDYTVLKIAVENDLQIKNKVMLEAITKYIHSMLVDYDKKISNLLNFLDAMQEEVGKLKSSVEDDSTIDSISKVNLKETLSDLYNRIWEQL